MIASITLGVPDLDRAMTFYRQFMEAVGWDEKFATRRSPPGPWAGFHPLGCDGPLLILAHPDCPHSPTRPGTGPAITFAVATRARVDAAHALALALGGADEGPPGLRTQYHADYYGAYVRDPDGNKLCFVCHAPEELTR